MGQGPGQRSIDIQTCTPPSLQSDGLLDWIEFFITGGFGLGWDLGLRFIRHKIDIPCEQCKCKCITLVVSSSLKSDEDYFMILLESWYGGGQKLLLHFLQD